MSDPTRERERELLGCALADPTVLADATAEREHFASPPYGNLWALMRRLRAEGEAEPSAWLSDVVGAISDSPRDYPPVSDVVDLRGAAPSVELWKYADDEVRRLSSARELRSMFADLAVAAKRHDAVPDDLIARAREELEAVAAPAHKADASDVVAAMAWEVPGPDWLTAAPPRREYLLHDARDPKSGGLEEHGAGMLPRGKVGILAAAGGAGLALLPV